MNMRKSIINFNEKKGFICDMDGVIYHGNQILPGVPEFIQWLHDEKKEYLFLTAKQDVYSYLLRVNKEDGSVTSICNGGEFKETPFMKVRYVDVETPKFINDLCGGLPFYPFDQNENSWIAKYEATDLLGQIDIDELKVTEVLMPEKKAQLIRILENLKEYDNPVIYDSNLKIE